MIPKTAIAEIALEQYLKDKADSDSSTDPIMSVKQLAAFLPPFRVQMLHIRVV